MPVFFYGPLCHAPLLGIVLGRSLDADPPPAVLNGHAVCRGATDCSASLVPRTGEVVHGLLATGLGPRDVKRLDYYAGCLDLASMPVTVQDGTAARVYAATAEGSQGQGAWDFADWCAQWAQMACHVACEMMANFGTLGCDEVAHRIPQIRARAWSRVLGAQTHAGQRVMQGAIEVAQHRRAYTGFFAVNEISFRHERFDGGLSPLLERSYFVAGDAALVLPYDPLRDRVLVVEQLRMGPLGRGDTELWHLEPIAGRIDPGETAQQAALREAREEAGLDLHRLETVARGYPSPGDSSGYFHIFVGLADLPDSAARTGGLASEAEDIRARLISFDDFLAMAEDHALANTPLALLAYWLAHHRSRLRS